MIRITAFVILAVAAIAARTFVVVWMPARERDEAAARRPVAIAVQAPPPAAGGFGDGSGSREASAGGYGGGVEAASFGDAAPAERGPSAQVAEESFRPGRHFRWTMPSTGLKARPFAYEVIEGMPDGLTLDPETGDVRGEVSEPRAFLVRLRARDADGATLLVDLSGRPG